MSFFINFLNILLTNEVKCKSFFRICPDIRWTMNAKIWSKLIQILIKRIKNRSIMYFFELDVCFFYIAKFNVSFLVVRLIKLLNNLFRNNCPQSVNNLFIVLSVNNLFLPMAKQSHSWLLMFVLFESCLNWLTKRHIYEF